MFGFFDSQEKKMRDNASNWLELASKVWNYRRDRLNARESDELVSRTKELNQLLKNRADAAKLKLGIESLEGVLMRTGGAIYPKTSLVENVEFFLVAAIVILGIRTYFVQPFKIPTNSMWPTYYGMTSESFPPGSRAPNYAERAFRFIAYGAEGYSAVAPRDGEVSVPLVIRGDKDWLVAYIPKASMRSVSFTHGRRPTRGEPASVRSASSTRLAIPRRRRCRSRRTAASRSDLWPGRDPGRRGRSVSGTALGA